MEVLWRFKQSHMGLIVPYSNHRSMVWQWKGTKNFNSFVHFLLWDLPKKYSILYKVNYPYVCYEKKVLSLECFPINQFWQKFYIKFLGHHAISTKPLNLATCKNGLKTCIKLQKRRYQKWKGKKLPQVNHLFGGEKEFLNLMVWFILKWKFEWFPDQLSNDLCNHVQKQSVGNSMSILLASGKKHLGCRKGF